MQDKEQVDLSGSNRESEDAPASFVRNDRVSPIAIVVLIAFWFLQSTLSTSIPNLLRHRPKIAHAASADSGAVPSDLVQGLLAIDIEAKTAYLDVDGVPSRLASAVIPTLSKSRVHALNDAMDLFRQFPHQPSLARRIILLRAETGSADPLAALPAVAQGKPLGPLPLDAFKADVKTPKAQQARLNAERATWQALFGSDQPIPAAHLSILENQIDALPNLRWWTVIAVHQLYLRGGNALEAQKILGKAEVEATKSVIATTALGLLSLMAALIGAGALVVILILHRLAPEPKSIFQPSAPRIRDEERRLGAGDLINIFVLYLILFLTVSTMAPLFLSSTIKRAEAVSQGAAITMEVVAEIAATIICGGVTLLALAWLARRRGASLADEIGLNTGRAPLPRIILFGLLGWCIALPLVLGISQIAKALFHSAPAPANDAIPLLMEVPGGIASVLLYILVAVIAPFFEETMFRGVFYNAARLRLGAGWGIVATGLAFGLSHPVGIAEQFPLAVLGMVFAWMAETRKSLMPSMFAHCLQNSFVYATLLFTLLTILPK